MRKKSFLFMFSIVLSLIIVFALLVNIQNKKITKQFDSHQALQSKINIKDQPFIGDKNAPITIVEYFDLKCPPCWQWNKFIFPTLKKKYIDTHKAKIIFINAPLPSHGKDSYLGSLALESAYQQNHNYFITLMDELYDQQKAPEKTWITENLILSLAKNIKGIDIKKLKKDLDNKTYDSQLKLDLKLVEKSKVDGTPTVFINDKRVETIIQTEAGNKIASNPFNLTEIDKIIKKELEK